MRAGRATVIDFKSFSFRERDAAEWANRLRDVTNGVPLDQGGQRYEEMRLGYRSLSTRNVRELARKYGATFVITEKPFRLALKVVYENGSYVVAHATQ